MIMQKASDVSNRPQMVDVLAAAKGANEKRAWLLGDGIPIPSPQCFNSLSGTPHEERVRLHHVSVA